MQYETLKAHKQKYKERKAKMSKKMANKLFNSAPAKAKEPDSDSDSDSNSDSDSDDDAPAAPKKPVQGPVLEGDVAVNVPDEPEPGRRCSLM